MSYDTPARSGDAAYHGELNAFVSDQSSYFATISLTFDLSVMGGGMEAPNTDLLADPNFQSFLDHIASWEGFTLPTGCGYTTITPNPLQASKSFAMQGQVTPTE